MSPLGRSGGSKGYEGTAVIRESEPFGDPGTHFGFNRLGTRKYRLTLDVRLPDRDPYEVAAEFKVPRKAENTGVLGGGLQNSLKPGLELPIRVDPRDEQAVDIDWNRYLATPGRKDAQRAATQSAQHRAYAQMLEKNPQLAAQQRAANKSNAHAWAAAVRAGSLSREKFEESVTIEVETGRMDPADADAARSSLA